MPRDTVKDTKKATQGSQKRNNTTDSFVVKQGWVTVRSDKLQAYRPTLTLIKLLKLQMCAMKEAESH